MGNKRRHFTAKFKTKVVLEALKERSSSSELAQKFKLHPNQITTWKRQFRENAAWIFEKRRKKTKKSEAEQREEELLKTIGKLKVDLDFLKKECVKNVY